MNTPLKSGREFYIALYKGELELEAKWLEFGAFEKVNSIETLTSQQGLSTVTLLELGCGTGAVIRECQRRGLGRELTAIDSSTEAIGYLQSHSSGIECRVADITDPDFALEGCYDVVVLSHVLEHLEQPLEFLHSLMNKVRFRYLVAEVPLEDLWAGRVKKLFQDRSANLAGHVQWFTRAGFRELISSATLEVLNDRRYVPILSSEVADFVSRKNLQSKLSKLVRRVTACYLPRILEPLWTRACYAHYAVICVPPGRSQSTVNQPR